MFVGFHNLLPKFSFALNLSLYFLKWHLHATSKVYLNLFRLIVGPKNVQQPKIFKFSLNIARYGKNATAVFLHTKSHVRFKENTRPWVKIKEFKLKFINNLFLRL